MGRGRRFEMCLPFFGLFLIFCTNVVSSAVSRLEVLAGVDNFIEDKMTNFSCLVEDPIVGERIDCFIRDRNSGLKTFLTNRNLDILPITLTRPDGKVNFSLYMRRDFSGCELVCKKKGKAEQGSFLLPEIKKTVEIEEVRLSPTNFSVGQDFVVYCDVKAARNPKAVKFRNLFEFFNPSYINSPSASWFRYVFNFSRPVTFDPFNNLTCQCQTMTTDLNSNTGNVMSKITSLTVHFFRFAAPSQDQTRKAEQGRPLRLNLTAVANPVPLPAQVRVLRCVSDTSCHALSRPVAVRLLGPQKLLPKVGTEVKFEVEFVPAISGSYRVQFRSQMVTNTSVAFFVNIVYLQFFIVPTYSYKNQSTLQFDFSVRASPPPLPEQFSVIDAEKRSLRVMKSVLEAGGSDTEFRVQLLVRSNGSSSLQVVFQSNLLRNTSKFLRVEQYSAHPNVGPIVVGVVAGCVIIVAVLVAVFFCFRRRTSPPAATEEEGLPLTVQVATDPPQKDQLSPLIGDANGAKSNNSQTGKAKPKTDSSLNEHLGPIGDSAASKKTSRDATTSQETPVDSAESKETSRDATTSKETPVDSTTSKETSGGLPMSKDTPVDSAASKETSGGLAAEVTPQMPVDRLPDKVLFKYYVPQSASAKKKVPVETANKSWDEVLCLHEKQDAVVLQPICVTEDQDVFIPIVLNRPGQKMMQDYFNKRGEGLKKRPYAWKKMHFLLEGVKPKFFIRKHHELSLFVYQDVDFVQISLDRIPRVLDPAALADSCWAVLVPGLRCGDKVFPQLRCQATTSFWRYSRRWVVLNEENLVGAEKKEAALWRRVWILFKDGDAIPDWNLLPDKVLDVYRREGANIDVEEGRLAVKQTSSGATWVQPCQPDDFDNFISHPPSLC